MQKIQLNVSGMKCGGCVGTVEKILRNIEGTENISVNLLTESAYFDVGKSTNIQEIIDNLNANGFPAKINNDDFAEKINKAELEKKNQWFTKWRTLNFALSLLFLSGLGHLAEGGYINSPFLGNLYFHAILATLALLLPGRKIISKGFNTFLKGNPDMDSLVALGVSSAYLTSLLSLIFPSTGFPCFFNEPVMLLGFILLGRFLEDRAKYQTGSSIGELLELQPDTARVYVSKDKVKEVRVNMLSQGQDIQLLAGDSVPADCIIIEGNSLIDVSHITGESKPIEAGIGDNLLNGSLNLNSTLKLRVIKLGSESSLAKLVNLIESVQSNKPPIQRLADKIAGKFTYFVLCTSIDSFFFWWNIAFKIWPDLLLENNHALLTHSSHSLHNSLGSHANTPLNLAIQLSIAVLVIACPCALGLATPTVITVASGKAAKKGIFFKGGDKIEIASKIERVIFDKTGTLTKGEPFVVGYRLCQDYLRLLQLSASLEAQSRHPIAQALIKESLKEKLQLLEADNIKTYSGRGISGNLKSINGEVKIGSIEWLEGHGIKMNAKIKKEIDSNDIKNSTIIGVSIDKELLGCILIGDILREDALSSIENLRKENFNLNIFSGDRKETVVELGGKLGFQENQLKWKLLPEQKLDFIEEFKNQHKVAMIGDGINDAPALAASDLGIAVGSGTQIAKANADVVLMGEKLNGLNYIFSISKKNDEKN